tara:strand:- start:959 stop:1588 length:630 start_codon:yes stop_codon:yes gene_type:complete
MAVIINGSNTPTAGGIIYGDGSEYDVTAAGTSGQLLKSNGASAPTWVTSSSGLTLGTPVATTSGTSVTFTGIPAGTKQVIVSFSRVSIDSTDNIIIRLGTSAGVETTGYQSCGARFSGGSNNLIASTSQFVIVTSVAGQTLNGSVIFTLENASANTFAASGVLGTRDTDDLVYLVSGAKSLAGVLDRVQITTAAGTASFDLGEVNIAYA